jgi:hypothetical protein
MALLPPSASDKKIEVSKLDAARRQLRTAIRLWFMEDDPVSVHTLAAAAHEIVHTLFRRKGHKGLLFDSDVIKDEYRSEAAKLIKSSATFFKHAQKDPEAIIQFDPVINEALLFFATIGIRQIDQASGEEEEIFLHWLAIHRPDISAMGKIFEERLPIETLQDVRSMNRRQYFEEAVAVYRRLKQSPQ